MSEKKTKRRDFLFTATTAVGAVGAAAVVWPMIDQMNPDASVKALASTEVHKIIKNRLKIPMNNQVRSLNIASSVAIVLAESLRQIELI